MSKKVQYLQTKIQQSLLRQLTAILLLINFLIFILPVSTNKTVAKQFSTSMPAEEEHSTPKGVDVNGLKLLHCLKQFNFSDDIFYLISKEKFSHYILHTFPVDWLETFSPPPDVA